MLWATITRTASEMCGLHKEYYRHLCKTLWWHHLIFLWYSLPMNRPAVDRVCKLLYASLNSDHILALKYLVAWSMCYLYLNFIFWSALWHSTQRHDIQLYISLTIRFISLGYVHCYVTMSEYINFKHYSSTLLSVHSLLRPVWLLQKSSSPIKRVRN